MNRYVYYLSQIVQTTHFPAFADFIKCQAMDLTQIIILFGCILTNSSHYRSIRDLLIFPPPDKSRKAQTPPSIQVRLRSLRSLHLNNHHWFAVHIRFDSGRQIAHFYRLLEFRFIYACRSHVK